MICKKCNKRYGDSSVIFGICSDCTAKTHELTKLDIDILKCTQCDLHKQITHKVVYRGDPLGKVLLIGEAPGRNEDERGIPFCGAAGTILDTLIAQSELPESSYIITNVLHCRPPGNRVPSPQEREACSPFLLRFINIIRPELIVPLGLTAVNTVFDLFEMKDPITSMNAMHGKFYYGCMSELAMSPYRVRIFPVYHPAAILYNRELYEETLEDFKTIDRVIR